MSRILLCTDLDRTLLPNGAERESEQARIRFCRLAGHKQITLVYVTGRHQQLVEQAVDEYRIPRANYVIADVGSTIYKITDDGWKFQEAWEEIISRDWQGKTAYELHRLLDDVEQIQLQESSKQNTFKLSYYVPLGIDHEDLVTNVERILKNHSIASNLVWSIDQQANIGLLDILPASAGKRQAIEFLMNRLGFDYSNTIFAGDSGNDICVMSSPIQSVLVANADENVRDAAIKQARANHQESTLYLARGNYMGMNGNYSAGILEGVVHYIPEAELWFRGEI